MIYVAAVLTLSLCFLAGMGSTAAEDIEAAVLPLLQESNIQMPGVIAEQNDTYLCTSYALNTGETHFLVGFDPIADSHSVHHVLLFGCEDTGVEDSVWNCGEMTANSKQQSDLMRSPVCSSQPDILYAWAHDAPKLELPKDVGFRVGGGTRNKHLVLQVHYMHKGSKADYSGVRVSSTTEPQPKTAATLLLVTGGSIKEKSTEQLESACVVDEQIEMHPFAFRVHTHRHGQSVSGWVVEEDPKTGEDTWALLGKRDPQLPQLFQPVFNQSMVIEQGDILAARCTIKNDENRVINVGPTGEDEMCNFYLMYWVEGEDVLSENTCFSPGAPNYYWSRGGLLNHIPKY